MKTYELNGKMYIQKPLVLGQVQALAGLLKGCDLGNGTPPAIIMGLGEKVSKVVAVLLIPEGQKVSERNMERLEKEMLDIDPAKAVEVITDFFDITPISSLLQTVTAAVEKVTSKQATESSN